MLVTNTTPDSCAGVKWRSPRDTRKDKIKGAAPFWDTWHRLGWPILASPSCILWRSDSPPSPQLLKETRHNGDPHKGQVLTGLERHHVNIQGKKRVFLTAGQTVTFLVHILLRTGFLLAGAQ